MKEKIRKAKEHAEAMQTSIQLENEELHQNGDSFLPEDRNPKPKKFKNQQEFENYMH